MCCKHCGIETEGARADDGRIWPICAERLRDLLVANGIKRPVNEEENE
jgi:hypothetical protein